MHLRIKPRLTYANVVSSICLFLVLGGTAIAAATINGSQIQNHSIAGKKLKSHTVGAAQLKSSVPTVSFKHTATSGNSAGDYSCFNNPAINNDPSAVVVAKHEYVSGSSQIYHNVPTGVWYYSARSRWCIYSEDHATPIPVGSVWDVIARP